MKTNDTIQQGSRIATMSDKELREQIRVDEEQRRTWQPGTKVWIALTDELRLLKLERSHRAQLRYAKRRKPTPQLECVRIYRENKGGIYRDTHWLTIAWNNKATMPEALEVRITKRDAEILNDAGLDIHWAGFVRASGRD